MLSRRELMGKAAAGAAATALAVGAATAVASPSLHDGRRAPGDPAVPSLDWNGQQPAASPAPAEVAAIAAPPPWELVSPLAAGAVLAHGWQLAELGPVRDGSCVVTLANAR